MTKIGLVSLLPQCEKWRLLKFSTLSNDGLVTGQGNKTNCEGRNCCVFFGHFAAFPADRKNLTNKYFSPASMQQIARNAKDIFTNVFKDANTEIRLANKS